MKLNLAQNRALRNLTNSNEKKALVVLPSGAGKTILSAYFTKGVKGRVLYLVHRNEIVEQAIKEFKLVHNIPDNLIGRYNKHSKQKDRKFVFATIQTLSREKNLKKFDRKHFEIIISDEHHHSCAETYDKVLKYFQPRKLLGLTATPYRLDGKNVMENVNNNIAYEMDIPEGINRGLLVPFKYIGLWDNVDYSSIRYNGISYTQKDLDKKLLIDKRDNQIIKEFKEKLKDRKTIGFCCSIKHITRCVKKFNEAGITAEAISYETSPEDRNRIIELFKQGRYQILFTRDIFNEGVDFPEVDGLLFLRPTISKTIFLQQLGRGLRISKGKKDVIVLDFIGNYVNAYMVRDWLKEIVSKGIGRASKPTFKYAPKSTITFDSKVIDLFEEQLKNQEGITKQVLIEDYLRVRQLLGRVPVDRDITKYSKYGLGTYVNYFGGWTKFKALMNDFTFYDKKKIIENYKFLKKTLKRPPFTQDWVKYFGYNGLNARTRLFGSYMDFIKSMGDEKEYKENVRKRISIGGHPLKKKTEKYKVVASQRERTDGGQFV